MPPVFKFYFRHVAIGFLAATVFVAGLLWLNVANLNHLITSSDVGMLALFMLWFFNGSVFAGVQTAVAVMLMAEDDNDDDDSDGPDRGMLIPIKISD